MLDSKDIDHKAMRLNRSITEIYTHKASGWRLLVETSYNKIYKAIQTHISEVRVEGSMEYPIEGGIHKRVYSVRCERYSDKALANAHREGEVMAMVAYGEHIKVGA